MRTYHTALGPYEDPWRAVSRAYSPKRELIFESMTPSAVEVNILGFARTPGASKNFGAPTSPLGNILFAQKAQFVHDTGFNRSLLSADANALYLFDATMSDVVPDLDPSGRLKKSFSTKRLLEKAAQLEKQIIFLALYYGLEFKQFSDCVITGIITPRSFGERGERTIRAMFSCPLITKAFPKLSSVNQVGNFVITG
jgi:hypothetical protein